MADGHDIEIIGVEGPGDFAAAMAIREVVFIEEQRVPEEIERDDEDPTAYHVLAQDHGHAVGTGRLVEMEAPPEGEEGRWGQVGRMAVLVAYRRHGVGSRILRALEAEAIRRGLDGIVLHAQLHAHAFYEQAGYANHGTIFEEAGIPHVEMRKRLAAEQAEGTGGGGGPRTAVNGAPAKARTAPARSSSRRATAGAAPAKAAKPKPRAKPKAPARAAKPARKGTRR